MAEPTNVRAFFYMALLTVVLSSAGFALLHFRLIGYGLTFFVLVPLCIGYFMGQVPSWRRSFYFSIVLGMVTFLYLLLTLQLEGMFCVLTLSPLLIALVFLGSWIGYAMRRAAGPKPGRDARLTLTPLVLLLLAGILEHYFAEKYAFVRVETRLLLPYAPERVYDFIRNVDTLDAPKPLLLRLGLSVPQKCRMEKEEVGAGRTCYFEEGTIEERVTALERGRLLKMEVTRYGLPGRQWLKFREASYRFTPHGGGTLLTRVTSYRTELKPRFYWRFWEAEAIEAEHEYVLTDLRRRLDAAR